MNILNYLGCYSKNPESILYRFHEDVGANRLSLAQKDGAETKNMVPN